MFRQQHTNGGKAKSTPDHTSGGGSGLHRHVPDLLMTGVKKSARPLPVYFKKQQLGRDQSRFHQFGQSGADVAARHYQDFKAGDLTEVEFCEVKNRGMSGYRRLPCHGQHNGGPGRGPEYDPIYGV